jgi:nucleotide-binding universal stress UspA family protein
VRGWLVPDEDILMSKQILVPVDGSEHAMRALAVACELAKAENRTLRLLHVVPSTQVPDGLKQYARVEHIHNPPEYLYETALAEGVLNAARDQALEAGASNVECSVEHGDVARGILDTAARAHVDTIVIGTRGLSDMQGMVFGSIAHKVAHAADCRVIMVK